MSFLLAHVDASALLGDLAQLDCPGCAHALGQHQLAGACDVEGCACNGFVSVAFIEADEPDVRDFDGDSEQLHWSHG